MSSLLEYCLPSQVNRGRWLTAYTLDELIERTSNADLVLPICSLGTSYAELECLGDFVLPPLFHEAMSSDLQATLLDRVTACFPYHELDGRRATWAGKLRIEVLPPTDHAPPQQQGIATFSVDTAVEEHGPHLPLATDRIQCYGVLEALTGEFEQLWLAPPVDYGHLTWGLPFGMSIDITPPLLTEYVKGYADALLAWAKPKGLFVVDVHGSIVHRTAIIDGLRGSQCENWRFRWLHEPLVEFAGDRGDQHAGGVETALVEKINPRLVDSEWFPAAKSKLIAEQMTLAEAISLSENLSDFFQRASEGGLNGIVGVLENYDQLDVEEMWSRMLDVARRDVAELE